MYRFFHVPVQSGSDRVLRIMKRKYDASLFREEVLKIRNAFPDSTVATDIIVGGHPGGEGGGGLPGIPKADRGAGHR